MNHRSFLVVIGAVALSVVTILLLQRVGAAGATSGAEPVFRNFTRHWRDDPTWHDGEAEVATYEAKRTIYGVERRYRARLYTNIEHASPHSKTKDPSGRGREVFKHHLREDAPTENYTYHFSTMCYVGVQDLKSLKIDMGSQDDCGATFKQIVNHAGKLTWDLFSYFPEEGKRSGSYEAPTNLLFADALSLILRGYPFDCPPEELRIMLLADQTLTRLTDVQPTPAKILYVGRESLELPAGPCEAHHLRVVPEGRAAPQDFWFASDGSAPMLQFEGPGGVSFRLAEHDRRAYWKR